jgi:cyclopropane-fatty-acyl-phospholipid synthase
VEVITQDMNDFQTDQQYDRILSVEMFEHLRNYQLFLEKLSGWLKPEGLLFVHIFVHQQFAYPYDTVGAVDRDWMTEYFFLGGQMPSDDLLLHFQDHLCVREHWNVNGVHYAKTLLAWLDLMDSKHSTVMPILEKTYGKAQAMLWCRRWRVFFLACAELFAFNGGNEWFVSHYLMGKNSRK